MDDASQILAEIAALAARNRAVPPTLVASDELRSGAGRTGTFVGADHGAGLSFFVVDNDPGQGPPLHRHPYPETWFLIDGEARIRLDDTTLDAGPGDTATVPAGRWHGFTNVGTGRLRVLCLHPSPRIFQEWKADPGVLDVPTA